MVWTLERVPPEGQGKELAPQVRVLSPDSAARLLSGHGCPETSGDDVVLCQHPEGAELSQRLISAEMLRVQCRLPIDSKDLK